MKTNLRKYTKLLSKVGLSILVLIVFVMNGWLWPQSVFSAGLRSENSPSAIKDGYGYSLAELQEQWEDANAGTLITFPSQDDAYQGPFPLNFSFRFYENTFTNFYVSTNGLITFGMGSIAHSVSPLPFPPLPNNVVAPLWADWQENYFKVYYRNVGTIPGSRYTIIEWEVYTEDFEALKANYEVILYEYGGDIVFQYGTLNFMPELIAVGIEDADGVNGLGYTQPLQVDHDIRFIRPLASPRVNILPRFQGGFMIGDEGRYKMTVKNNGEIGPDIYNLTVAADDPTWSVQFLNNSTGVPLTDTNHDGIVDTGSIPLGGATAVSLSVRPPIDATVGSHNNFMVTARSTEAETKFITTTVQSAVPVQFVQIFADTSGIHLEQIWENSLIDWRLANNFPGSTVALGGIDQNFYFAAWEATGGNGQDGKTLTGLSRLDEHHVGFPNQPLNPTLTGQFTDIHYRLSSRTSGPGGEQILTNGSEVVDEENVFDANARSPAIATSPDGNIVAAWTLLKSRQIDGQFTDNSNVYMAVLNDTGANLSGLQRVSNYEDWNPWGSESRQLEYPNVVVTGDLKYVVCWSESFSSQIRCTYHVFNNATITPEGTITAGITPSGSIPEDLSVAAISANRLFVTYTEYDSNADSYAVVYTVWDSSRNQVVGRTLVPGARGWQPRAIQFDANENILLVWVQDDGRLGYAFLDNNYNLLAGYPKFFEKLNSRSAGSPSLALDDSGHAIITWLDADVGSSIFYALLSPNQTVLTPPMIFISDRIANPEFITSDYGFGVASYAGIYQGFLPLVNR